MAAAATVGLSAYSMLEQKKAAKKADSETKRMQQDSDARSAELLAEQNRQRRLKGQLALSTRTSLMKGILGGGDRGGSLLTSPRGLGGSSGGYGREALGG